MLARERACLLICNLPTTTGSCLAREFFRLEGRASILGERPELITKLPSLHLKGVECVFGVLPKFRISMPRCHVKQQVEDCLVVRREE